MLRRLVTLCLLLLLCGGSALAADISGRWNVKISTTDGQIIGVAGFTQSGNDVTGWLGPSESDSIPITLALKGKKLTIWTHPQPGRDVAFSRCDVSVGRNKMSGTIDSGKGKIEFTRTGPSDSTAK